MVENVRLRRRELPGITHALLALIAFVLLAPYTYARVELAPCKNNYSPQQQLALGQKVVQQVYTQMPVLPDSSPVSQYVQKLGQKLAGYAPGYKWPYKFHVANVAEINAFALPGGTIFVNLGTIQAAANEAQLAGVMAHEISHVVLQHAVCNAAKQEKVGMIAGIGQIAAGVLLGGAAGAAAQETIGLGAGLGFLKMSRGAEQQADLLGVGILYDAGYDPHAMPQFFEVLESKYGKGGAQFLSDHPNPGNRSEYIDKEIATFVPRPKYITDTPAFDSIKTQVAGLHAYTAREISSGVWKSQSPNQTVGNGVNEAAGDLAATTPPDLNTSGKWKTFRGTGFSIEVPGNWQRYGNELAAMLAPPGGITRSANGGAGNVVYGVLIDRYQPQQRTGISAALDSLMAEISRDNPGLVPGPQREVRANGVVGRSMECNNPSGNNGRGEHDWVVAFPQPDGYLRYFVFVAPSPDFGKLQPTFTRMVQSIKIQS